MERSLLRRQQDSEPPKDSRGHTDARAWPDCLRPRAALLICSRAGQSIPFDESQVMIQLRRIKGGASVRHDAPAQTWSGKWARKFCRRDLRDHKVWKMTTSASVIAGTPRMHPKARCRHQKGRPRRAHRPCLRHGRTTPQTESVLEFGPPPQEDSHQRPSRQHAFEELPQQHRPAGQTTVPHPTSRLGQLQWDGRQPTTPGA